jgi:AraC-like DNA-binding protein
MNMTAILIQIQAANLLLCLLLSAQMLFMRAMRPVPKRILGLNFLLYANQSLMLIFILTGHIAVFSIIRPMVAMLLGPTLYIYFLCVRRTSSRAQGTDALHFIGGLLIATLLMIFMPALLDAAIIASFVGYFFMIGWQMRSGRHGLAHLGDYAEAAYRLLYCLMLMSLINIALEIAVTLEMRNGVALRDSVALLTAGVAFLALNFLTMIAVLNRSNWLEWMYQFDAKAMQQSLVAIDEKQAAALLRRWEELIRADNLYKLEFGITLAQAAKKLQVPARQLSVVINQVSGKSYSTHLNDMRIEEAQRLLLDFPTMPVIEVMQESGFSSKSNFNKEFLRVSGCSPTVFRDTNLKSQSAANQIFL